MNRDSNGDGDMDIHFTVINKFGGPTCTSPESTQRPKRKPPKTPKGPKKDCKDHKQPNKPSADNP